MYSTGIANNGNVSEESTESEEATTATEKKRNNAKNTIAIVGFISRQPRITLRVFNLLHTTPGAKCE
jgi:hypothetical protein